MAQRSIQPIGGGFPKFLRGTTVANVVVFPKEGASEEKEPAYEHDDTAR